jgi:hypothetical protein
MKIIGAIVTDSPHIDLRGQPEIQDLGDHVGRLKIEGVLREGRRQLSAQFADIVGRGCMPLLERHQDHAVIDADRRAVGKGQIIEARGQADIVDDQLALAGGDDLTDLILDSLEDPLGLLDAGAGGCADMELDLPAVDDWKEVAADKEVHDDAEGEDRPGDDWHNDAAGQQCCEQLSIAVAQSVRTMFKAL